MRGTARPTMTRTTNSVAILRLHVHADARDRATAREGAERFARRVIDAACEALEARAPGRAIVIPRLAARWS